MTAYFHVDKTHADYTAIHADCAARFALTHPDNALGVNVKKDDAEAVIKVCCVGTGWPDSLSWGSSAALLGASEAPPVDLVSALAWADPDET